VKSLKLLGGQQTHPVLLAALAKFQPREMERLLWLLEVIIFRYQFIGGGRTGRIEIVCARLAEAIFAGSITDANGTRAMATASDVFREASEVYPDDDSFEREFSYAQERNNQKAVYVLRGIERELRQRSAQGQATASEPGALTLEHVLPKNPGTEWQGVLTADPTLADDGTYRFGNMCLLVGAGNRSIGRTEYEEKKKTFASATAIEVTKSIPVQYSTWGRHAIDARQAEMARIAKSAWRF
jgi:hypothetical protein